MKILSINSLGQVFQMMALVMVVYLVVHKGVPLSVVAGLLFVRLAFRLLLQLIGGILKIVVIVFILYLLTLVF